MSRGAAIATLYATDFAEIRLPLADRQLAYLDLPGIRQPTNADEGPSVRLFASFAGAEHTWQGRIVRTEGEIDPQSRMVHVVARVEDPYGTAEEPETAPAPLAVGLFVRAEIDGRVAQSVIVVPRSAMRDADRLLVVDRAGRLHLRDVEVLRIDRDEVMIRTDLDDGDRVVVSPIAVVVDGMKVRPIHDSEAKPS